MNKVKRALFYVIEESILFENGHSLTQTFQLFETFSAYSNAM